MGQTLTHGIYLPDEGERNCYSGLASNWQILDSSVGTIAAHTAALAGKAPLVHTHTKSDITDFPAYGNAAGTICEGNDSRLSDARTPVAHTHGKADITDLFNSANTWSNVNTYTSVLQYKWLASGGYSDFRFKDQNDTTQFILRVYSHDVTLAKKSANGSNAFEGSQINFTDGGNLKIQTYDGTNYYIFNFTPTSVHPSSTNTQDLGTSTNKWKTLNGINPGALSLPDYTLAKVDLIDFSRWSVSGQRNNYTPISDGWLFLSIKDTASNSVFIYAHGLYNSDPTKSTDYSAACFGNGSQGLSGRLSVMIPVRAGIVYGIFIKAASVSEIYSAKFYPALGNV